MGRAGRSMPARSSRLSSTHAGHTPRTRRGGCLVPGQSDPPVDRSPACASPQPAAQSAATGAIGAAGASALTGVGRRADCPFHCPGAVASATSATRADGSRAPRAIGAGAGRCRDRVTRVADDRCPRRHRRAVRWQPCARGRRDPRIGRSVPQRSRADRESFPVEKRPGRSAVSAALRDRSMRLSR